MSHVLNGVLAALAVSINAPAAFAEADFAMQRRGMMERIREMARTAGDYTGRPELDPRVLAVIADIPRHEFVPDGLRRAAYKNRALPIGEGQTISQPYIVALMTDLLELRPSDAVLEIGTGSGYQAAILSKLAAEVYTIEIVEPLARRAQEAFARLGLKNIHARVGDGYGGWPERAPFDAIIVTAAPDHVPQALIEQLRPGGRLVIPVGAADQELMVIAKKADGAIATRTISPVKFVPLTRGETRK